ncbi:MAG: TonB-dependent receptor [Bacteroidota bacterium]|nr:TonB-dependent receptor [Bacteroidota bacterium]
MKTMLRLSFFIFLIIIISFNLFAGNTGKIVGKITDAISGEAVIGVNVLVVGTTRGAITDMDGKYTIIGVPIGGYTVRASQVGYATVEVSDVKVGADETTPLNFKLTSSEVQLTGVTITADQQLVNTLTTSSTQTVSEKAIQSIPNVKSVEDVLRLQAGVVKQGNNLFLRGGRANEVQYLVDGIPTNNIIGNSGDLLATTSANAQLAQLYAGVQSGVVGGGASGLAVSANAIQSVSVQTSGFDADYGNAQSGIINIVTKSGSDRYTGSIQYRTDRFVSDNQNEAYTSFSVGGPEPITKYLLPTFGFKPPGALTFFLSADIDRSDGAYNYAQNEFYNPIERKVELKGFLGGILDGVGFRYRDNQNNSFTINSKLRYDISGDDQISYGYRASLSTKHNYLNLWKYRADSSSLGTSLSIQHNLSWQHFFSPKTFIRWYLAKLENQDGNDVAGLRPPDYSFTNVDLGYNDLNRDGFMDIGTGQRWYKSKTEVITTRFDFNSQIHPLHMLKSGFEFNSEHIYSTEIHYPTGDFHHPDSTGNEKYSRGEYPGYGIYRWHMNQYPSRGGLYIQDNIELAGLNLHVGIRYDFFDLGKQVYDLAFIDAWKVAYNWEPKLEGKYLPDWVDNMPGKDSVSKINNGLDNGTRFWYFLTHGYFSPRLSIGYPVTDRIVFYFNYGHFLQLPDRDNYYRDPFIVGASGNWIGNPNLKPQRTVAYEAGFENQFSDDMAFAVHAFYKDIFDYPALVDRGDNNVYKNLDYASARGFEITLNQAFAGNFSTAFSYSYQIAKGRSSNPLASIFQPEYQLPRETRLDWDQNHTANIFATYRVGQREEGKFFGLPFVNNYGISVTWSYGSGFPYTGFQGSRVTARNVYLINSETAPYTTTVNLNIYKGFYLFETINLLVTFDIQNLLDRRNPTKYSIFNHTGRVFKYGDIDPDNIGANSILPYSKSESMFLNPTYFDPPRQFILGIKMNWD